MMDMDMDDMAMEAEDIVNPEKTRIFDRDGKHRIWLDCPYEKFRHTILRLKEAGARLTTISAYPESNEETGLNYFFELENSTYIIRAKTQDKSIDSLFALFANADFIERETNKIFGVKFLGHPHMMGQ